jgi:hypothetical protein
MADDDTPKKKPKGFLGGIFKKELPKATEAKSAKKIDSEFLSDAMERVHSAYQVERPNIEAAYEDLEFLAGDQWPAYAKQQREAQKRPILTIDMMGQFVRQVTGDMRLMHPAIKVIPVDARGKKPVAELISGMIRYIENRSEAQSAYAIGADSQVSCGIGHWRVTTEYAEETTFNQEIRITQIDDGVAVLWDPDAKLPTKEDAMWCFVPIDISREKFKKQYPNVPVEEFTSFDRRFHEYWFTGDTIRIGEYWEKKPAKRRLACLPDGSIDDLTDATDDEIAELKAKGARVEMRDGHKIYRSVITIGNILEEPEEWSGRMFPIVPVVGEEIRIGRKIVRQGIIRKAKDAQRMFNYNVSTKTELDALAPKAPWLGTEKNFEEFENEWSQANEVNWPYLRYTPDPKNGNAPPQRNQAVSTNPGLSEGIQLAQMAIKQITGLYDASLGARSNETSGVAIKARQQEGDVGTVAYAHNFSRAVRHTGRILVDLIPHVYDTERMVQVLGEDGTVQTVQINKATVSPDLPDDVIGDEAENDRAPVDNSGLDIDPDYQDDDRKVSAKSKPQGMTLNDVTVGAYDVIVHTGPDYSTKRDEAREGMAQFIQAAPEVAPLILDLYAKAQDWPLAQEIGDRLKVMLPPPIQALIAHKQTGVGEIQQPPEPGPPMPPPQGPPPPPPGEVAAQQADVAKANAQVEVAKINLQIKELELEAKRLEVHSKARSDVFDAHSDMMDAHAQGMQHAAQARQSMQPEQPAQPAAKPAAKQTEPQGVDPGVVQAMAAELAHQRGMIEELMSQVHARPQLGAPMPPQQPIQ